jgi:hypothetical protein
MDWTYDVRGLDALAWLQRAADELAAQRAAGDSVTVLLSDTPAPELDALRQALADRGHAVQAATIVGVRALVLGPPADASEADPAPR